VSVAESESQYREECHFALVSQLIEGFSHHLQADLLAKYGSYRGIFTSSAACTKVVAIRAQYHRRHWQPELELLQQQVENSGAKVIPISCTDYPPQLKQIQRPPPVLYVLGNSDRLHLPQIAIVGSRRMTRGGETNAGKWAQYLAEAGFTITSGLAVGIDGAAHLGALLASPQAGSTIAVMATGIDQIYPYRHRQLAEQILQADGALITEFAPGSEPVAARFPQRNRIISGLSLGVLVVEAAVKSGSLITARYAMEQDREVFAIPGSIHNPQSRGCHWLIKQGATLVETAADIVVELTGPLAGLQASLPHSGSIAESNVMLDAEETQLLNQLGYEATDRDSLGGQFPAEKLSQLLISLELKGVISNSDGLYQRLF
jgi:DNA processing protein